MFAGAEVLSVDIKIPIKSRHDIVAQYREMLDTHSNVKIAVLGKIMGSSHALQKMAYCLFVCVCVCMCPCVRACVRACVRVLACMHGRLLNVRGQVRVCVCVTE